jgi:hypothetical protein
MGNKASAISFTNVTHAVNTRGGLLLDASAFANASTYESLDLTFHTVWVVNAEDEATPIGPYEATFPETHYENLSGRWSGALRLVTLAFSFTYGGRWGAGPEKGRCQK